MATPAQCFYCFECLSASFKGIEPPNLRVVEDLWEAFEASKELDLEADHEELSGNAGGEEIETEDEDGTPSSALQKQTAEEPDSESEKTTSKTYSDRPQFPRISRLQGTPSSRSSSSSTPSALSVNSSRSMQTNSSSTTSISSSKDTTLSQSKSYSATLQRNEYPSYPLFVTWNTLSRSGHKSLRGCIGTFEAQELSSGLKSYALTSAFGDTRFSPISESLLPSLSCSLTLLSSFEECSDALDWDLGTHGIRISFLYRNRRFGATYLPDVPIEQGWTQDETLESLMRKAGWDTHSSSGGGVTRRFLRGSVNASSGTNTRKPWDEVSNFKVVRYQGLKASASYAEWQEWRKWVNSSPSRLTLLNSDM